MALLITAEQTIQGSEDVLSCNPEACCSDCCGHPFLEARLLYLRAFEGGLSSPCDSTQITDTTENGILVSRLRGKGHEPNFKWNLGFRIGAGYEFADSNCDIGAYWTHYNSQTGSHNDRRKWKIDFDVVDILYRCDCDTSTCFSLSPYGGLRCARINQKLHTHFIDTVNENIFSISNGNSKAEFLSIGPLVGVEGDWGIGCGFSLYGNVSVSVLYGTFRVNSHTTSVSSTDINNDHLSNHIQACQPVVDFGFGVRWKGCFCTSKVIVVHLGLEEHRYFNHNQFCGYGDLSLDGVSLAVGIEY